MCVHGDQVGDFAKRLFYKPSYSSCQLHMYVTTTNNFNRHVRFDCHFVQFKGIASAQSIVDDHS